MSLAGFKPVLHHANQSHFSTAKRLKPRIHPHVVQSLQGGENVLVRVAHPRNANCLPDFDPQPILITGTATYLKLVQKLSPPTLGVKVAYSTVHISTVLLVLKLAVMWCLETITGYVVTEMYCSPSPNGYFIAYPHCCRLHPPYCVRPWRLLARHLCWFLTTNMGIQHYICVEALRHWGHHRNGVCPILNPQDSLY